MAGRYNFEITQGETLRRKFAWKAGTPPVAVDLTGCTTSLILKPHRAVGLDLSSYLTLDAINGEVDLVVPDEITQGFTFSSASYDLLVQGGDKDRLIRGVIVLKRLANG